MDNTTSPESRDCFRQTIIDEIDSPEESTQALKFRHNEHAPVSRLPYDVLATIFSFLSLSAWNEGSDIFAWLYASHVCRRWRETALSHPLFWSRINLTKLTPVGMAEIFSRAKMVPLHLEGDGFEWKMAQLEVFEKELEAHISHTCHLTFSGFDLSTVVKRLVSPTPILESFSLTQISPNSQLLPTPIPDNAPSLISIKLNYFDISWKSPTFKGLRILEIRGRQKAMPELDDWLDALNGMPQLKELSLRYASPVAPSTGPRISRTVTLPSLTHFKIHNIAKDCVLALAHLVFPALTLLHVGVKSRRPEGEDVLPVIPFIIRNVCVMQDIEPIRSVRIDSNIVRTGVYTWTTPGADVKAFELMDSPLPDSACFLFIVEGLMWNHEVNTPIFDALLSILPMNSVSTLTVRNGRIRLGKEFWLRHAPRWPLLEQACMGPTSARAFWEMLAEEAPPDSPRLPSLTRLILFKIPLTMLRTYHLGNMLIKRMEQGVPLECLDLQTCVAVKVAVRILAQIVVDVQEPLDVLPMNKGEFLIWQGSYYWDVEDTVDEGGHEGHEGEGEDNDEMDFEWIK